MIDYDVGAFIHSVSLRMIRRGRQMEGAKSTSDEGSELVSEEMGATISEDSFGSREDREPAVQHNINRGLGVWRIRRFCHHKSSSVI